MLLDQVTNEMLDFKEQSHRGRILKGDYQKRASSPEAGHGGYRVTECGEDRYGERVRQIDMLWKEIRGLEILLLAMGSGSDGRK